ncbi:MAG: GNAT family N-acetyltransferase [Thermomicrobiales bacterium]
MESPEQSIEIRCARPADSRSLLDLKLALDHETATMMFEPGERVPDPGIVERDILEKVQSPNSTTIVAVDGGRIVGYVEATGGEFNRNRHLAMVVAGVRVSHGGRGIGSRLFQALVDWADETGLIRLELTVMIHNAAARRLYEKFGFKEEGIRVCSVRVDGECVDEVAMARIGTGSFAGRERNG